MWSNNAKIFLVLMVKIAKKKVETNCPPKDSARTTRSESFDMTAFKNHPPGRDFVKGKDADMLQMRKALVNRLMTLHRATLAARSDMKTSGRRCKRRTPNDDRSGSRHGASVPNAPSGAA